MDLHSTLVHVVTQYDMRQSKKPYYNIHALPLYLEAIEKLEKDYASGIPFEKCADKYFGNPICKNLIKAYNKFTGGNKP